MKHKQGYLHLIQAIVVQSLIMSFCDKSNTAVLAGSALAKGRADRAHDLLSKGDSLHLQKAAEVLVSRGQCEAMRFLINECKLDVDKHNLLHLALLAGQEDLAKLLIVLGANVNQCWQVDEEDDLKIPQKYPEMLKMAYYINYDSIVHLPLHLSVNCSVDMMRVLLQSGADVNRPCGPQWQYGKPALHIAVETGNVEKIRLLIDHGADIDAQTCKHDTALTIACDNPSVGADCVQVLLEKGADPNSVIIHRLTKADKISPNTSLKPIHCASERADIPKIQLLLKHGAHLEARTSDGHTALTLACKASDAADCVRILLENGAFPNVKISNQQTPLTLAREQDDVEKISLLKQYGASEEERTATTALMSACERSGDVDSVRHLLENNASPINLKNSKGETALHYAAPAGDIQKLQLLVKHNSNVNLMDDNGMTPLMMSCNEASVSKECVQFLLENKALPNLTNINGKTALHHAAKAADLQKVKMLVEYGANVKATDIVNITPLIEACFTKDNAECVRFLLENGASPNVSDTCGYTALHQAACIGSKETIKLLVQYRADLNAVSNCGKTPLKLAFTNDQNDCVLCLLQNNAWPHLIDESGNTTLHWAVERNDLEIIDLLLQLQVDVDAMTQNGETPLMLACKRGQLECTRTLLQNNALPDLTDNNGYTALHLAAERGDRNMMDLLVQYQADVNATLENGETLLMLACAKGSAKEGFVDFLLEKGALVNLTNKENKTALHYAVTKRTTSIIQKLIEHRAEIDPKSLLSIAARSKRSKLLELIKRLGADISAVDSTGQNAVMLAASSHAVSSNISALQRLVDIGVSVNQKNNKGWTPLMATVYRGSFKMAKILLEAGADVHTVRRKGNTETTILDDLLGTRFNSDCVGQLIRNGIVNNFPTKYNAFLHKMIMADERKIIAELVSHGMGPTLCRVPDVFYFRRRHVRLSAPVSPLTVALKYGTVQVIQYLIANLVLCPCDLNVRFYHSELRPQLYQKDIKDIMDEFYAQPKSLFHLSFVTVSHAIGGVPGRVDRVNSLPLPQLMKDALLFKTDDMPMDVRSVLSGFFRNNRIRGWTITE